MRLTMLSLVLVSHLAHMSCTDGGTDPSEPWIPPPKDIVDTGSDSVFVGRLWVAPNPIRIRPAWGGTTMHDTEAIRVYVENVGSEDAEIEYARINGTTDVVFYDGFYAEHDFPIMLGGGDCSGSSGWVFELRYIPVGSGLDGAYLVLETEDPTSPTIRVPILLDETGRRTPPSHNEYPVEYRESMLEVYPNPIRLDAGTARDLELCVQPHGEPWPRLLGFHMYGDELELIASPDDFTATLRYTSTTGEPLDGSLVVGILTSWGDELNLVVPVLVR